MPAARAQCREREVRGDDLVLVTREAPPSRKAAAKPPRAHLLALVASTERLQGRLHLRLVAHLRRDAAGLPPPFPCAHPSSKGLQG